MPLYPGTSFHGDMDVTMGTGLAKRVNEPALSLVGESADEDMPMRREWIRVPSAVLLNPYGNSIEFRSEEERRNAMEVMTGLSRELLKRGCAVYTNTPFPEQEELPGTKRFEGDIIALLNGISGFDLVVTVFTGFMEVVMYTECNLVVLRYSDKNTRKKMARMLGRSNYWEFNVLTTPPDALVSQVSEVYDGVVGDRLAPSRCSTARLLSLEEKAACLDLESFTPRAVRILAITAGRGELAGLLERGTKDPMLCCVCASVLESGKKFPRNLDAAIKLYRKAYKGGVAWAKKRVRNLKRMKKAGL
ncbi:MAG: hypothetical protein IKR86_01535 [Candidatus Methanomethylophilaceae archaeon]|nr:hypothetical protein [Candidatus Methanomethylophilaceae archaeon]